MALWALSPIWKNGCLISLPYSGSSTLGKVYSGFGLSTQLYNAYIEAQDQLLLEKLENKRITKYLDEIVQEVEAKAPILKRQREEYERSQKAVASLSAKLEQAMKVCI